MNYITSIRSLVDGTESSYMLYYMSPTQWEFGLSDGQYVSINELLGMDVAGIAPSWLECCMVVAKQDSRTMKLCKYVKKSTTAAGTFVVHGEWDSCILLNGDIEHFSPGVCDEVDTIAIDTGEIAIEVCGVGGSVCIRSSNHRDTPEVFNLYGLLGTLCRELGISLLKYRHIRFHSDSRNYTTDIELEDSLEATRFFSKMSIAVSGNESLGFKRSEGLLLL